MTKCKVAAAVLIFLSCVSALGAGDSFVGNGGSAGDLELLVAKKQLQKTFSKISSKDLENSLCTCEPIFEGRGECSPLVGLDEDEVLFCSDQLQKMSGRAARMIRQNNLSFRWTKEDIYVRQGTKTATADAVANTEDDSITLNQKRFLALTDTERLFLLAHEIFHLVPFNRAEDSYLSDEGVVGPYKGRQGSRRLLNAMAAGTVVEAYRNKSIQSYRHILWRRKSYVKNWFDLTITPSQSSSDVEESVYAQESFGGFALSYTKYFGKVGFTGRYTYQNSEKSVLSTITSEETQNILGLGLSYKILPFKDPTTFLGQSFIGLSVFAELTSGEVSLSDGSPAGLSTKDRSFGGALDLKYHLPLQLCWVHLGAGVRKSELNYSELGLTNDKMQPYFNIGASYAF